MTNPGIIGDLIPGGEDWLNQRIAGLQRQINELRAASSLGASSIDEGGLQVNAPEGVAVNNGGGVVVNNGGAVIVNDTGARSIIWLGALPAGFNRADGSAQPGFAFYREDGSLGLFLGDLNPATPPYKQAVQLLDRAERVVVADDTNSGHGLAAPHIVAYPMQNTNVNTWPGTTSTSWTQIANGFHEVQNPLLQWSIQLQADAGTTGQVQLQVNGSQIGTTQTVSGGFASWSPAVTALPAGIAVGMIPAISLQARVTAGSGSVRAICYWMSGVQSP